MEPTIQPKVDENPKPTINTTEPRSIIDNDGCGCFLICLGIALIILSLSAVEIFRMYAPNLDNQAIETIEE